jgi:hypothetical protein
MGITHLSMATSIIADEHFQLVGESGLDERNRVTLSKAVEQLRALLGDVALSRVHLSVAINGVGQILLTPQVRVAAHEAWLLRNPEALSKVREGIAQAGRGETVPGGSFAEFADDDLADE